MIKTKYKKILIIVIIYLSSVPLLTSGATLFFEPASQKVRIGEQFEVEIFLDTENEGINAIEGKVIFPENLLEIKEIKDGGSIINLWIEKPQVKSANQIIFSGVIPGGYIGKRGLIFSVIFEPKNKGEGVIEIREAKALLNDGKGSQSFLSISNLQFLISEEIFISQIPKPVIRDTYPPELFSPIITRDPEIFNGKFFLVFLAQDKDSGIDHYAVYESRRVKKQITANEWIKTESPYILKDQKLRSFIYVKAVDKVGNERIIIVEPRYPYRWYEKPKNWIIIILGLGITYFIIKKFYGRKRYRANK